MSKIISSCSKSQMIKFGALLFVILGLSSCATTDIIDQSLREFTYQADAA